MRHALKQIQWWVVAGLVTVVVVCGLAYGFLWMLIHCLTSDMR